VTKKFGYLKLI